MLNTAKSNFNKMLLGKNIQHPRLAKCIVIILLVAISAGLRIWPLHILGTRVVWLTFYPATIIAALFGGFICGVFSIILSFLAAFFLWPLLAEAPFFQDYIDWIGAAVFILNGVMISAVAYSMRLATISATQAQEKAELYNKELESFSYSVSHDLRAPIRGIDEWSLALKEDFGDLLGKDGGEYLDRVRSESQRMGTLINNLLKLAVITRARVDWQDVNLSERAELVKKRILEENAHREIFFTISPNIITRGDPNLLEILLTQFFDNASKFTSKVKEAKIEFGKIDVHNEVVYFVRDNGAGFNMDFAQNLFGPFQRMHAQSEFPGTGIGLATAKRILSLHQGKVWVETGKNQGATFYFTINEYNLNPIRTTPKLTLLKTRYLYR